MVCHEWFKWFGHFYHDAGLSFQTLISNDGSDIGNRVYWDIVETPNVGSSV